jgi:tetratricopeptide (TPR) repeat protein
MLQSPSLVTEANVQDWRARLEALVDGNRLAELPDFERWMMLAFGRDADGATIPIDVRLHRRLGELYLGQRDFARACAQLTLARRAAPRDIFVLRPLGESRMKQLLSQPDADAAARTEVESVLAAIEDLDQRAFVSSPDAAALFGKYVRRVLREPERAAGIYARALEANPDSYYLADLLAQTQLESGRVDAARATYAGVLAIVGRLGEQSVWSHASAATAHLVLGDVQKACACIEAATRGQSLSQGQLDAIAQGLREVAQRAGVPQPALDRLLAMLAEAADRPPKPRGFNL